MSDKMFMLSIRDKTSLMFNSDRVLTKLRQIKPGGDKDEDEIMLIRFNLFHDIFHGSHQKHLYLL